MKELTPLIGLASIPLFHLENLFAIFFMKPPQPGEKGFGFGCSFPFSSLDSLASAFRLAQTDSPLPSGSISFFPLSWRNTRKKNFTKRPPKSLPPEKSPRFLPFFPSSPPPDKIYHKIHPTQIKGGNPL
eukprot:FR736278.1.p2 GENE.FR736278.1~~FR736278.1.p2  ORF type:complete len:129 (+),score=27.46 FR736278.1:895-1281(+)